MALFPIESLPTELLQKICLVLDDDSLFAFSLVNKYCRTAAYSSLFETLHLNVFDHKKMGREVRQWNTILTRCHAHAYVRTLHIAEGLEDAGEDSRTMRNKFWALNGPDAVKLCAWHDRGWEIVYQYQIPPPWDAKSEDDDDNDGDDTRTEEDSGWKALGKFSHLLPALKNITYACPDHFPRGLQELLQKKKPKIGVSMKNVILDLDSPDPKPNVLNKAITPYLHSITLSLEGIDTMFGNEPSKSAIENVYRNVTAFNKVMQEATDLKEIYIRWSIDSVTKLQEAALSALGTQCSPIMEDTSLSKTSRAPLTVLHIHSSGGIGPDLLEYWTYRADFTKLKNLKLELNFLHDCLEWLNTNTADMFASLESLFLFTSVKLFQSTVIPEVTALSTQLTVFLRSLRPLVNIRLRTDLTKDVFTAILEHHGSTLRQLWLDHEVWKAGEFLVDADLVDQLRLQCPLLGDLRIPIQRTRGDRTEVELYQKLGMIKSLRRLHLDMYTQKPNFIHFKTESGYENNPDWDDFDQQEYHPQPAIEDDPTRYGHFSTAFANLAMDDDLAQTIFEVISSQRGPTTVDLELLHLMPDERFGFSLIGEVTDITRNLARRYALERDTRDTHRNEISVRWYNENEVITTNSSHWNYTLQDKRHQEIFCRLWPQTEETLEKRHWWRDSWHSFPLAITREEIDEAFRVSEKPKPKFTRETEWKKRAGSV